MIPIYVPDLKRKLDLVARHGNYKNLGEIAAEMGVKEPTLRSWTVHRTERPEGSVSRNGREPIIRFYCAHLPHLSREAVIDLLEGPYDDMAASFLPLIISGLSAFIEKTARFEGVAVYNSAGINSKRHAEEDANCPDAALKELIRAGGIARIKMRGELEPTERLPIGIDFRLEFPLAHRSKFALGVQKSPLGWGFFPVSFHKQEKIVRLPRSEDQGDPNMMCEDHDQGASRFALIQSMKPFPDFIHALLLDGIPPSRTDIGLLSRHIQEIPKADLTIHAIDIAFFQTQFSSALSG